MAFEEPACCERNCAIQNGREKGGREGGRERKRVVSLVSRWMREYITHLSVSILWRILQCVWECESVWGRGKGGYMYIQHISNALWTQCNRVDTLIVCVCVCVCVLCVGRQEEWVSKWGGKITPPHQNPQPWPLCQWHQHWREETRRIEQICWHKHHMVDDI